MWGWRHGAEAKPRFWAWPVRAPWVPPGVQPPPGGRPTADPVWFSLPSPFRPELFHLSRGNELVRSPGRRATGTRGREKSGGTACSRPSVSLRRVQGFVVPTCGLWGALSGCPCGSGTVLPQSFRFSARVPAKEMSVAGSERGSPASGNISENIRRVRASEAMVPVLPSGPLVGAAPCGGRSPRALVLATCGRWSGGGAVSATCSLTVRTVRRAMVAYSIQMYHFIWTAG